MPLGYAHLWNRTSCRLSSLAMSVWKIIKWATGTLLTTLIGFIFSQLTVEHQWGPAQKVFVWVRGHPITGGFAACVLLALLAGLWVFAYIKDGFESLGKTIRFARAEDASPIEDFHLPEYADYYLLRPELERATSIL